MARIEHYDDPDAPKPNSLVPAASAIVTNGRGEILMQRRVDNNYWALPGGTMDFGETIVQTAEREVREETGLDLRVDGIVGTFSDPRHVIEYSDGEVRQQFNICFHATLLGGELRSSNESNEVRWIPLEELKDLEIHHTTLAEAGPLSAAPGGASPGVGARYGLRG
jgi:ADP-ribose pyrophosphatase YjhB (NUDIX family)